MVAVPCKAVYAAAPMSLADVLNDPDRARSLGRSARRAVEERYDRSDSIGRLHQILRDAVRGDPAAGADRYSPNAAGEDRPASVST